MKNVHEIAQEIVAREGGYVDDPDDLGGATHFGVTLKTLRRLDIDLNEDQIVDLQDLKKLSPNQAIEIFTEHYFTRPRLDELPAELHASVFDMYVNSGKNAVRILQRLLNEMGLKVAIDGIVGPKTIEACFLAKSISSKHFVDAYGIARRNYYYHIADKRPSNRKFATTKQGSKGGWIRRAEEFISPRYHLSHNEHEARVASWG